MQMIYKRAKLTVAQRCLRTAVTNVARELKASIRADMPRDTGTLRLGLDYKVVSRDGNAKAIIGVKSKYVRMVKPTQRPRKYHPYIPFSQQDYQPTGLHRKTDLQPLQKLPNLYAAYIEARVGFIRKYVNANAVNRLRQQVINNIEWGTT